DLPAVPGRPAGRRAAGDRGRPALRPRARLRAVPGLPARPAAGAVRRGAVADPTAPARTTRPSGPAGCGPGPDHLDRAARPGTVLAAVRAYERGAGPAPTELAISGTELARAYLGGLEWAMCTYRAALG